MKNIIFKDDEHIDFYYKHAHAAIAKCDTYRMAFFYLIGVLPETRAHLSELWENNGIRLAGLENPGSWQTHGTLKICRLAYNLYNGYCNGTDRDYTPNELFASPELPYMVQAIKIRFEVYDDKN